MVSPGLFKIQNITGLPVGKCMMMCMYRCFCHWCAKISLNSHRPKVFLSLKAGFILT